MHFEPATLQIDALRDPPIGFGSGNLELSTGQHLSTAGGGVERVEYDQATVIHPAIRVAESMHERGFEGQTRRVRAQADLSRVRQALAAAQVIVEEQAEADLPERPKACGVRQDEAQRPDDMRRDVQQSFTLGQCFTHEAEFQVLEISKATVDQLGAGRGGEAGEIALLDQQNSQATTGGFTADASPIDATAHDKQVDRYPLPHLTCPAT